MNHRVVVLLGVTAALIACATARERHQDSIQASGRAMERAPGGAREALAHLDALNASLGEPNDANRAVVTEAMLVRAASFADQAAARSPDDAAVLLAREGLMWSLSHEADQAEAAYRRSVQAKPTPDGLRGLMDALGARAAFDDVRSVCGDGASALADHELQAHVQGCASAAHATAGTDAASWLADADRVRLEAWRTEQARQDAIEAKKQEEARARAEERKRKVEGCVAVCQEKAAACKTMCQRTQPECPSACDDMGQACAQKCEASFP